MSVTRKTIGREAELEGVGLHSGASVRLRLRPARCGNGIVFERRDLDDAPKLTLADVYKDGPPFRSALKSGHAEVHTVEHLLAALAGLGVTDAEVSLDGPEVPGLDGSAQPFVIALHEAGIVELNAQIEPVWLRSEVHLAEGASEIMAWPADHFQVAYELNYPNELLLQGKYELVVTEESFLNEIAPMRTFCPLKEATALRAAGFGMGANTHNTLVVDGGKVLDNSFRIPGEPVRHKILDLIGDLYLLGRPVRARIEARRSGHKLNRLLVEKLTEELRNDLTPGNL